MLVRAMASTHREVVKIRAADGMGRLRGQGFRVQAGVGENCVSLGQLAHSPANCWESWSASSMARARAGAGVLARLIGELEQILFDLRLVFDERNVGSAGGSRL